MADLDLTYSMNPYDRVLPLITGEVTPEGIAFHEQRFSNNVAGTVSAGPMLRARNLTGQAFREFLCERITQLVRSAMRRQHQKQS